MALNIGHFRTYFLYGAPPYQDIVQFTSPRDHETKLEQFQVNIKEISDFAVNNTFRRAFQEAFGEKLAPFDIYDLDWKDIPAQENYPQYWIPNFFTHHYREYHRPYYVNDGNRHAVLSKEALNGSQFFAGHELAHDIHIQWDFIMGMETCPIIYVVLESKQAITVEQAVRLSSLHLCHERLIPKTLFEGLDVDGALSVDEDVDQRLRARYAHSPIGERDWITLDELVQSVQYTLYSQAGFSRRLAKTPMEAIVRLPFTSIEVDNEYASQEDFVAANGRDIAALISRPSTFEFNMPSHIHTQEVLENSRVWSVAEDTYFVMAYSGALYVKLNHLKQTIDAPISNYRLADEHVVFHSFRLAVANYYILRLIDAELDEAIDRIKSQIAYHREAVKDLYSLDSADDTLTLSNLNELVIHVSDLRFKFLDLLEELDNSDKLIDEEWHIDLLDKINRSLGMIGWRDSIKSRLDNLRDLVHVLETSYERFLNLTSNIESADSEKRLFFVTIIFSAFAGAELLGLLLDVSLGDSNEFYLWVKTQLPMALGLPEFAERPAHFIASVLVLITITMIAMVSLLLAQVIYTATHQERLKRE